MTTKNEELSFEQAIERLETIVDEMESGKLSLDDMMRHFEEGTRLGAYCTGKLNEVERKIEMLVKENDELAKVPFEAETAGEDG